MAGWKCLKKKPHSLLLSCVFEGSFFLLMLFRMIAFSLVICFMRFNWLSLALLCPSHSCTNQIKLFICFVYCVCLLFIYAFCSVWNAGIARKKRRSLQGWLFAKRSGAWWKTNFLYCYKNSFKILQQQLRTQPSRLNWDRRMEASHHIID